MSIQQIYVWKYFWNQLPFKISLHSYVFFILVFRFSLCALNRILKIEQCIQSCMLCWSLKSFFCIFKLDEQVKRYLVCVCVCLKMELHIFYESIKLCSTYSSRNCYWHMTEKCTVDGQLLAYYSKQFQVKFIYFSEYTLLRL